MPKTFQARPIYRHLVELKEKKIDIILPFFGNYEKVYRLLKQIWGGLKSNPYQIYLIDDCSPNEVFIRGFESAPWTKVIRNETQLGFGGALAAGFNKSIEMENPNELVVFLHSDCHADDSNWLWELLKSYMILKPHGVGLVSARTDNPVHDNPQLKGDKSSVTADVIVEEGYVPLHCAVCEKSLFKQINGFIKPYKYGFYEDEELAYRMRKHKLKQGISGGSWIGHEGGATFNKLKNNKEVLAAIDANREQCIKDIKSLR